MFALKSQKLVKVSFLIRQLLPFCLTNHAGWLVSDRLLAGWLASDWFVEDDDFHAKFGSFKLKLLYDKKANK